MAHQIRTRQARRTREEWTRIVEGLDTSGLSAKAYCQRESVSYASLCYWRAKLRKDQGAFPFIELKEGPTRAQWDIELELGAGVFLRLRRA